MLQVMSEYEQFLAELLRLCEKHNVKLATSDGYARIEVLPAATVLAEDEAMIENCLDFFPDGTPRKS